VDLRLTDDETRFRDDLRAWLRDAVPALGPGPADVHDWSALRDHEARWQRMLFDAGYAGINWPVEFGGQGRSPTEHLLFLEESARAGAPETNIMFVGLLHAGPTLMAEASPEQKAAHLPRILRGDEVWCQGFSEPGAGSDLASLRTRAVRDGDEYVVNGQKIWTSNAQVADFCELLVRTDPEAPKHKGISWVILPMTTPGITIRPLTTITGSQEFSEVFFDDVRVPVANRVGDENDGWRISMVTFSFERGTAFTSEMLQSFDLLRDLKERSQANGTWDDAGVRRSLGRLAADLDALWALTKRNVSQASRTGVPGVGGSVFKLHYSEMRKRMGALAMEVMGPSAVDLTDVQVDGQIHSVSLTIAAGTSQIQRNIVGERILGLPKER
jgi:alkylation response protein AidB-like acyl-CoA dehydrogenase